MTETTTTTVDVEESIETPSEKTFSAEYVRELRAEARNHRKRVAELDAALKSAQDTANTAGKEADAKIAEANSTAQQRIVRSELKAMALKHGMVDLDGLKMLDLSSIKLNDDGSVDGADAVFEAAKTAKPFLFGRVSNTSSTVEPPKPASPTAKRAKDMTPQERAKALENIKRGR